MGGSISKRAINPSVFSRLTPYYSLGLELPEVLIVTGQVGRDEGLNVVEGKREQFVQCFENIKKVLVDAGYSFDDVYEMVTYHVDMRGDLGSFLAVKDDYIQNSACWPTWTGHGVTHLSNNGVHCEVIVRATKSQKRAVIPPSLQELTSRFRYSPAVIIGEKYMILSGQVGRNGLEVVGDGSTGVEDQYKQMFRNVEEILVTGGAGFEDIVDISSYHCDVRDIPRYEKVRAQFLGSENSLAAAWTAYGIPHLSTAGVIAEIKCTAILPSAGLSRENFVASKSGQSVIDPSVCGSCSSAVRVGNMLFLSAQSAGSGSDDELSAMLANVSEVLDQAGAKFEDVVEIETAHIDMRTLGEFIGAKGKVFSGSILPCWSAFGASQFPHVGTGTQMRCVAALPSDRSSSDE